MTDLVLGLVVGGVVSLVIAGIGASVYVRRLTAQHDDVVLDLNAAVLELRQDAAEDKETNRRLRHELAVKTPSHLLETTAAAEMERDGAVSERDQAIEQLDLVQRDLAGAKTRLADQEAKLRQYREALQEIRLSLEAQGRSRAGLTSTSMLDTGELTGHTPGEITAQDAADAIGHHPPHPPQPAQETADLGAGD